MKLTYFSFPKELWRTIRTSKGGFMSCASTTPGNAKAAARARTPARQLGIGDVLGGVPPMTQGKPPVER